MQRILRSVAENTCDFFKLWWTHRDDPTFWIIWGPPLLFGAIGMWLHGFWYGILNFFAWAFFNHVLAYVFVSWCLGVQALEGQPGPAPKLFSFPTWFLFRLRFRFGGSKPGYVFRRAYTLQEWNWGQTAFCRRFDLVFWLCGFFGCLSVVKLIIAWSWS